MQGASQGAQSEEMRRKVLEAGAGCSMAYKDLLDCVNVVCHALHCASVTLATNGSSLIPVCVCDAGATEAKPRQQTEACLTF